MDTRAIKPEDNKGGTFTQQLTSGETTTAYINPVPTEAPGVITAEPGTAKEEAIFFRTRDAGAGTIGGLIRDYTNLNGGVGQTHENGEDWEVFQSALYVKNLVDIILEGFFYEMAVIARTGDTTFTVVGNKAIFYTAGRLLRCNEDSNEMVTVVSSSYSAGTGLTTVTISGTLPDPLTDIELGIQPKTAGYLSLGATIVDANGNEIIKIPATTSAVNEITIKNAATGSAPEINPTGDDTNINLEMNPKGTGVIKAKTTVQLREFGVATDGTTGDGKTGFEITPELNGFNLVAVRKTVDTAGTTGTDDTQIRRVRAGTPADMLSTKITIDSTETSSSTAATPAVIDTSNDDVATGDMIYIDQDAVQTTKAKGGVVSLTFAKP